MHLAESVRRVVGSLKGGTIQMIRESEEEVVRHSRLLEEQVRERTAALEASNRAATLYLDIMGGHDINNANNVANLYADLLQAELEGEPEAELLGKARKGGLTKSIEIVHNVNTIQKVQGGVPSLRPIDLDAVIRVEIEHSPAPPITYAGTTAAVLADDLLSEIFANLIGNAVKHGGPSVEIAVRVEERGEEVLVSVEDTGPGIPDAVKARLFERLVRGGTHSTAGGTGGLGLYICRMLTERYGGKIRAADRVEGRPEEGGRPSGLPSGRPERRAVHDGGRGGRSPRRFGTHLMLVMILITLPVIGLISALDYRQVAESLIAEEDRLREQTERGASSSRYAWWTRV
ncbi:ATP-binding protein [Methanoculleus chikugoensis]|uniref:sensor histidine kinase n=1 Tax=Methanoculleus chikugoensis TaxID=118126 RepID=UPI000AA93885|nr:ATP-binding protein [Methanoculleus chikugoensis]